MAVAYVAKKLGINAVICISKRVPKAKVDSMKRLGAQMEIYGDSQDAAGDTEVSAALKVCMMNMSKIAND